MKFKLKHCVSTHYLTPETYAELICRMISEGNVNTVSHIQILSLARMWNFIGMSERGEICIYDRPHSFLGINEWMNYINVRDEDFPNIYTKEWLEEYLK